MSKKPNIPALEAEAKRSSTIQLERFKEAARALECDDDPKAFKKLIGKIAKAKPGPKTASS
jgi:hypothetical protein